MAEDALAPTSAAPAGLLWAHQVAGLVDAAGILLPHVPYAASPHGAGSDGKAVDTHEAVRPLEARDVVVGGPCETYLVLVGERAGGHYGEAGREEEADVDPLEASVVGVGFDAHACRIRVRPHMRGGCREKCCQYDLA